MIEYALRDIDDNEYVLNDASIDQPARGSFTYTAEDFQNDNRIVPNSAIAGSVKLGKTRLMSREITLRFTRAHSATSDFRTAENVFMEFLQRAVLLVDKTNSISIKIAVIGNSLPYDVGSHKLSSSNEITLMALEPFWKALTPDNETDSLLTGTNTIALTNSGYLETPPIITLTAVVAVTQFQIYIDATKNGIQIDDTLFGTISYNEMVIDCEQGTVKLEGVDRTQSILPVSGYFTIPVGSSDLKIVTTSDMDIDMDFYKRYYI